MRTLCLVMMLTGTVAAAQPERRVSFNEGWLFAKGEATGAEQPGFSDAAWRKLELPHDWAIEGPFDPQYSANSGGLPFHGVAWYRKHFTLPASVKGRFVSVEFDGAMSNARVWLNGKEVGARPYGYIELVPTFARSIAVD